MIYPFVKGASVSVWYGPFGMGGRRRARFLSESGDPCNTTATLFIPKQYTEVMESGKCMEMKDNTLFLGSGVYHFIMK